ncbi:MAG: hypothetical protein V3S16_08050 [Candidatus Desulfatibia sp.]|uniref:hypothetical protein n=1 Tax=Candidatus Desulfatibia sp. TaxID=3101189 RepID=UPI002F3278FB
MKRFHFISIILVAVVFSPSPAQAYLDPGTGGMLLQGLLAALAAVIVAVKTYWGRIKGFFKKQDGDG